MPKPLLSSLLVIALLGSGCSWVRGETRSPLRIRPGPVIQSDGNSTLAASAKVAVMPFHAEIENHSGDASGDSGPTGESATLVASFFTESLLASGTPVVAPNDMELVFRGENRTAPTLDPVDAAAVARRDFGAKAVVLGRVLHYRERDVEQGGANTGARVAFEVSLYDIETKRRMWFGRFDETQSSVSENVFRARVYPGRGTRWLSAAELARWGAEQMVASLHGNP